MPPVYEDYVWRLTSTSPAFDVQLPQDLEWIDEFGWNPVQQSVEFTLSGAMVVQEASKLRGRPITLQGQDDMAWISRATALQLKSMKETTGLVMLLQYVDYDVDTISYGTVLFQHNVMFRHYDPPVLDLESVRRFDNFESNTWYKVRNIKFMETTANSTLPCSANVVLTVSTVVGTFLMGDVVTGLTSLTTGIVLSWNGSNTLQVYTSVGTFTVGEVVQKNSSNHAVITVIS